MRLVGYILKATSDGKSNTLSFASDIYCSVSVDPMHARDHNIFTRSSLNLLLTS